MTLIVGVCSGESVVMACDTQLSIGNNKYMEGHKIKIVDFGDIPLLVGKSGSAALTNRYVEILMEECGKVAIERHPRSASDVGKVMSEAMRLLRKELEELYECTSRQDLDVVLRDNDCVCHVMVGCRFGKTPSLVTVSQSELVHYSSDAHFRTLGSGSTLANYIVRDYAACVKGKMGIKRAVSCAIATVDRVKELDIFCGGETEVAIIAGRKRSASEAQATYLQEEIVDKYREIVRESEEKVRETRRKATNQHFNALESLIETAFSELSLDL